LLTIPQIESILAIHQHGTATAAARALNRAVQTVSHHLGQTEQRLGVALFTRRSGRFVATRDGAEFIRLGSIAVNANSAMSIIGRGDDPAAPPNR
jgi:DNA-binding transcriptional LysR family regulator